MSEAEVDSVMSDIKSQMTWRQKFRAAANEVGRETGKFFHAYAEIIAIFTAFGIGYDLGHADGAKFPEGGGLLGVGSAAAIIVAGWAKWIRDSSICMRPPSIANKPQDLNHG